MQRGILAVSPNLPFLEQIRSHLEEGGRYRVVGVTSGSEALTLVKNTYFDLAILDAESSDVPFVPFTRDLVAAQPGLKLLVFPPQNNPHHPVLTGLVANGFLKKPFFTPEVSRAFSDIFNDKVEESPTDPQPITSLAELWMKRPEVGFNRVEQLLGSTTAQTGLLIARSMVIAASGAIDDDTIQQVLNMLEKHKLERDSLELLRFITLENNENLLVYASQLIPEITLVLFYAPTTSVQLARQEVYQVKNEFKEAYPTTSELRKELDASSEKSESENGVGLADSAVTEEQIEITNPENPDLKSLDDEIGFEDLDIVLSSAELKNLDSMLSEMPPPDPEQTEGSEVAAPETLSLDDLDLSSWLPLPEENQPISDELLTHDESSPTDNFIPEPSINESEAEFQEVFPPLPNEFREQNEVISEQESEITDYFPIDHPDHLAPDEISEEPPAPATPDAEEAETFDFDTIWGTDKENTVTSTEKDSLSDQDQSEKWGTIPQNEEVLQEQSEIELFTSVEPEADSVKDETFNSWLEESVPVEEPQNAIQQGMEEDNSPKPPPLPAFDIPIAETENDLVNLDQNKDESISPEDELDAPDLFPDSDQSEMDVLSAVNPLKSDGDWMLPSELPSELDSSDLPSEPGTSPLGDPQFPFPVFLLVSSSQP